MAGLSGFVKHFEDSCITFKDGTGTPLACVLTLDNGDISIQGLRETLREVVAYERKGQLQTLRLGKRTYPTGTLTMMFAEFSEATVGTLFDFLAGKAATPYAARISTTTGQVFTCDIQIDIEGSDYSDVDSDLTLEDCDVTIDWSCGEPASCSISFTCYGAVSGDFAATE